MQWSFSVAGSQMPGAIPANYQPTPQHFSQQPHPFGSYQGPHQQFENQTLAQQSTQMPVLGYEDYDCGTQPHIHGIAQTGQTQTQHPFQNPQQSVQIQHQIGHLVNPAVASFPDGAQNNQLQLQGVCIHENDITTGSYQPLQAPGTTVQLQCPTVSDSFPLQDRQTVVPDGGSDKEPSQEHQGLNISSSFPYLDVRELNDQEVEALCCRLDRDVRDIENEYSNLIHATIVSMEAIENSAMKLSTRLNTLGSLKSTHKQKPLLLNHLDEINQAKTAEKVFHILRDYHSFFNYGVIESIIGWFGTPDNKKRLEAYKEHFKGFCKRRTFECPSDIFGHYADKGKSKLVVKLQGAMDPSLTNVTDLRYTLSDILEVKPDTLFLYRIKEGCVELMFQVPSFIEEDIFPLSVEQERSLPYIGVSRLTCGSYSYVQVCTCMKILLGASPHNSPLLSATSTTAIFP